MIGVTYKDEVPIVWLAAPVLDEAEIVSRFCLCRPSTDHQIGDRVVMMVQFPAEVEAEEICSSMLSSVVVCARRSI